MRFVDCFVVAVPTDNRETYIEHCKNYGQVFKDYGAVRSCDCWGTDISDGEVTSFPMAVKAEEGETVCMGWVEWPSREVRDEGMPKVMLDERMRMGDMPFDGKRLIFGGFEMFSDT